MPAKPSMSRLFFKTPDEQKDKNAVESQMYYFIGMHPITEGDHMWYVVPGKAGNDEDKQGPG